jgi:hypothetical protein
MIQESGQPIWKSKLSEFLSPSALVLIIANLVPVYGVLIPGWKVFPVIFLFSHKNPDFWLWAFSDLLNGGNLGSICGIPRRSRSGNNRERPY